MLPGIIQRVLVSSSRPDIPALLSTVYTRAASRATNGRIDTVPIACVPIASPLLGPNGQLLIDNGEQANPADTLDSVRPTKKSDLYSCGVAAKITGIEGRGTGEFALLVEGVARIKIEKIYQAQPYFEGKASYHYDEGMVS